MPDVIIRKELYHTFGGRSEYLNTPMWEIVEERCRILKEHEVTARKNAEVEEKVAEQEAEAERVRNGGR